jgi:hypothetical protein
MRPTSSIAISLSSFANFSIASAELPDGKTAIAVDSGRSFIPGNNTESHRVTLAGQTLDPMHAGIATFDSTIADDARVNHVVLLLAVIRAGTTAADDIALRARDAPESRADEAERRRPIDARQPVMSAACLACLTPARANRTVPPERKAA